MVGAVITHCVFSDETALAPYQKNFFLDRYHFPPNKPLLVPEIIEVREIKAQEITPEKESCGYDRFGRMNRIKPKGLLVDSYH